MLSTNIDKVALTFFYDLFLQHRVNYRINIIFDALDDESHAFFHTVLQEEVLELRVVESDNGSELINGLSILVLDPVLPLDLRIDHERETGAVSHHDPVLH